MFDDDYTEEDEASTLAEFSARLTYEFSCDGYDIDTFKENVNEKDDVLAAAIKPHYPEVTSWPTRAIATAWRRYSRDVGLVEEELVCARLPGFLAYLFVVQENWPVAAEEWVNATDAATIILWPDHSRD